MDLTSQIYVTALMNKEHENLLDCVLSKFQPWSDQIHLLCNH